MNALFLVAVIGFNFSVQYSEVEQTVQAPMNCPNGQCPLLPPPRITVPGFNGQRPLVLPPIVSEPAPPLMMPRVEAPAGVGVGDFNGDGVQGTEADFRIHLSQHHGVNTTGMSLDEMKAVHTAAHPPGSPPQTFSTQQQAYTYSRPRGRFRDGQGWWLGKLLGRPMPHRLARRR